MNPVIDQLIAWARIHNTAFTVVLMVVFCDLLAITCYLLVGNK